MYEPHGAYDYRIVYPAFRETLVPREYIKYLMVFPVEVRKVKCVDGFEHRSAELRRIEDAFGLSLSTYTEQDALLRKTAAVVRRP